MLESVCDRAKPLGCTDDFLKSSDTNVLYLIIANYDGLQKNTSISSASSVQQIEPLWAALGQTEQKLYQDSMHSLVQTTLDGLLG